jgi:hypothetical protein
LKFLLEKRARPDARNKRGQTPAKAAKTRCLAGVVTDGTGGVLPGVSVEASSPALIEKVRTAVTDREGRYTIPDLRPGVYTVTFALAGFSTVRREGSDDWKRGYNYEMTAGVQHQLLPRLGVNLMYYHRQLYNLLYSENVLVSQDDFFPVQIVAPVTGDELPMPPQEGVRCDQRRHLTQDGSSEAVAVRSEPPSLRIGQPQAPPVKALFQDAVLFS